MLINYEESMAHPTLSTDPVFGHVMTKKENCLQMLQLALPELHLTKIIKISEQKKVSLKYFEKSDRYDVWAVDEQGRKYDIECQTTRQSNIIERLYRYLLKLQSTVEPLLPGEKVPKGHASYAICFGTYSPGQDQRARYSISMHDDEKLGRIYDNLGHIVMFNTKAKDRSMISAEMAEFLDLLDGRVNGQPNKFTIKLQDDIHEFISSEEWSDIMTDLELYREELIRETREETKREDEENAIFKMIKALRTFSLPDSQILKTLSDSYGSSFSNSELERMLKSVK